MAAGCRPQLWLHIAGLSHTPDARRPSQGRALGRSRKSTLKPVHLSTVRCGVPAKAQARAVAYWRLCAFDFHAAHRMLRGVLPCAPAQIRCTRNITAITCTSTLHGAFAQNIRDTCDRANMRRFQVHFHNFEHTRNMLSASQRLLGLEFKTLRGGFVSVDYYGRQATARSFLYCGRGLCLARACTHARAAGRMAAHCVQCISSVCRDAVRDAVRHSVATVLPPWCLQVMLRSSHVGVNAAALEAVCTTLGTDQIIGYSPPLPPAPSTPPPPPHTHTPHRKKVFSNNAAASAANWLKSNLSGKGPTHASVR